MKRKMLARLSMDVLLMLMAGGVVFAVAARFDVFERFFEATAAYENLNADELIFALLGMMVTACFLIFLRTREFYSEITLRDLIKSDFENEKGMYSHDIDEAVTLLYETDTELEGIIRAIDAGIVPCLDDMRKTLPLIEKTDSACETTRICRLGIRRWEKCLQNVVRVSSHSRHRMEKRSGWRIPQSAVV